MAKRFSAREVKEVKEAAIQAVLDSGFKCTNETENFPNRFAHARLNSSTRSKSRNGKVSYRLVPRSFWNTQLKTLSHEGPGALSRLLKATRT